jgi:hypothetical protein
MMMPREFVREIIMRYHAARLPLYPHERVFRGGSRSVSSEAEDLLARYLIERLPADAKIYINETITSVTDDTRERIKPDLIVTRGEIITAVLDLKMDLGYNRATFPAFWRDRDERVRRLRGRRVVLKVDEAEGRRGKEYNFGAATRFLFVLVSELNISREMLEAILAMRGTMGCSDLFVLTGREHPNVYGLSVDEALDRIAVYEPEFAKLEEALGF